MPMELGARTPEGVALVALAERLADELSAGAAARDQDGSYPFEGIEALRRAGYFGAPVPEELGGLGVGSIHDAVIASGRLARGDASLAIGINMHLVVVLNLARRWGMARVAGNARREQAFGASREPSSWPAPQKPWMVERECVPLIQRLLTRSSKRARSDCALSASRVP